MTARLFRPARFLYLFDLHGRRWIGFSPAPPFQHVKLKDGNLMVHLWSSKQFRRQNRQFEGMIKSTIHVLILGVD